MVVSFLVNIFIIVFCNSPGLTDLGLGDLIPFKVSSLKLHRRYQLLS